VIDRAAQDSKSASRGLSPFLFDAPLYKRANANRRGGGLRLVPRGKWQQGDIPGLLDGAGKTALVLGADAGQTARHNLAALGHKTLQQPNIAVGNGIDFLGAELANLLAAEEFAASAGSTGGASARSASGPSAGAGA
jgi:hypothetical protein